MGGVGVGASWLRQGRVFLVTLSEQMMFSDTLEFSL